MLKLFVFCGLSKKGYEIHFGYFKFTDIFALKFFIKLIPSVFEFGIQRESIDLLLKSKNPGYEAGFACVTN